MSTIANAGLMSAVYVSSATSLLTRSEIVELLRGSRERNSMRGLTGLLLYKDGNFLQVLEGPEKEVSHLLNTIERDGRHRGVIVLSKKAVHERLFSDWSMAFKDLDHAAPEELEGFNQFLNGSLMDEEFQSRPELAYKLLRRFKESMK